MEIKLGMKITREKLEKDGWEVVEPLGLDSLIFKKGNKQLKWTVRGGGEITDISKIAESEGK